MGTARYICRMYIKKNKNRSGSISIQIIQKVGRRNKLIKTIGCSHTQREEELLLLLAKNEIERLEGMGSLFNEQEDLIIDAFVENIENKDLQIVGPQIVIGELYNKIGYHKAIDSELFKYLVIHRLVEPGSKLKSVKYLDRHLSEDVSVYTVYRFLDKLNSEYKGAIEQRTFKHTRKILKGQIGIVFYDMTTLYFEATREDELRVIGYSKDGKHQHPQIMIGLMVGKNGYPIGYEIFEGNKAETKTLLPILESFERKFNIEKPTVVADAALLSQKNIDQLNDKGYKFILGGRIKNETNQIKEKILSLKINELNPKEIKHDNGRLILTYSTKRQKKDYKNRTKGLERLQNKIKSGKLSKQNINNRGYNKYLKLKGETTISIDYEKFNKDSSWDGLKGYITNTELSTLEVLDAYHNLWLIEKAFRISKTDLRIRPIFHRLKNRIEAHICICFTAYAIYKEFERLLKENNIDLTVEKAIRELKDIQQLTYILPKANEVKTKLLKLNDKQKQILGMF